MTYGQLPKARDNEKLPGGGTLIVRQPFLYCPSCDGEFSANPGDYWNVPKDREIECGECHEPMLLSEKLEMIVPYGRRDELAKLINFACNE